MNKLIIITLGLMGSCVNNMAYAWKWQVTNHTNQTIKLSELGGLLNKKEQITNQTSEGVTTTGLQSTTVRELANKQHEEKIIQSLSTYPLMSTICPTFDGGSCEKIKIALYCLLEDSEARRKEGMSFFELTKAPDAAKWVKLAKNATREIYDKEKLTDKQRQMLRKEVIACSDKLRGASETNEHTNKGTDIIIHCQDVVTALEVAKQCPDIQSVIVELR